MQPDQHPFVANCDQDPQILVDFIKRKNRYEQHGDDCGSDEDYDDDEDGQFLDESEVRSLFLCSLSHSALLSLNPVTDL